MSFFLLKGNERSSLALCGTRRVFTRLSVLKAKGKQRKGIGDIFGKGAAYGTQGQFGYVPLDNHE